MNALIHTMDRFFDDLIAPAEARFQPACEVEETSSRYLFSFDLPGVAQEDVKIEWADDQLIVSGERKWEGPGDKANRRLTERAYGAFRRVFTLPASIDVNGIEARFHDGVLEVEVPKAESVKPKQIKITAGKRLPASVETHGAA